MPSAKVLENKKQVVANLTEELKRVTMIPISNKGVLLIAERLFVFKKAAG